MCGLRVGQLALRLAARAFEHAPRLLLGVLAELRRRGQRRLLALLDERIGTRLRALERVLCVGADAVGLGALRGGAVALRLGFADHDADLLYSAMWPRNN